MIKFKVTLEKKKVRAARLPVTTPPSQSQLFIEAKSMLHAIEEVTKHYANYNIVSVTHPSGAVYH